LPVCLRKFVSGLL